MGPVKLNNFHKDNTERGVGSGVNLTMPMQVGPVTKSTGAVRGNNASTEVTDKLDRGSGVNCWENSENKLQPFFANLNSRFLSRLTSYFPKTLNISVTGLHPTMQILHNC